MELKHLGKYEIVAKIGQGGMGEVFRAHDPILGRNVALKTIAAGSGADEEMRKRFHREAQSAARLNHPNITTVYDFGEEQGHVYIAMELLQGKDLKETIADGQEVSLETTLSYMEQICDGLAFAHAGDVVHRDLKPANIHIQRNGQVKIMDFGLARISSSDMTRAGLILGTPNYMSPEQVKGAKATARSDVFALGAVFYELMTGHKSFDADSMAGVLYQVMQTEPEPIETARPDLSPELCQVIRTAMAKDPAQRYADAAEMREALRSARATMGLPASAPAANPASARITKPDAPTLTRVVPARAPLTPTHIPASTREATARAPAFDQTRAATAQPTIAATLPGSGPSEPTESPQPRVSGEPQLPQARPRIVTPSHAATPPPPSRAVFAIAGLLLAGAIGMLLVVWLLLPRSPRSSDATPPLPSVAPVAPALDSDALGSARRALEARDYKAAASRAEEILAVEPGNASARQIVDDARRALRELSAGLARAREALEAGDTERAARVLAPMDAGDPEVERLATRLNDVLKGQAQEARRTLERARQSAASAHANAGDMAAASALARAGEDALRRGDLAVAVRQFSQSREAYERALRVAGATPPPRSVPTVAAPTPLVAQAPPPPSLAPTTAPPTTAASAPPSLPPAQSETAARQAIRGVLDEYRAAFERLNADALKAVQPGVDYDAMKKTFTSVTGYTVRIDLKEVSVDGDTGTASCLVTYNPTPKPAGKLKPVATLFHLRRTGDVWLIERLERK